jgi:hypothetical protein
MIIPVPFYDTLGASSLCYAAELTQFTTIFVNKNSLLTLFKMESLHKLKKVISIDELKL